jgi:hypothetical protein
MRDIKNRCNMMRDVYKTMKYWEVYYFLLESCTPFFLIPAQGRGEMGISHSVSFEAAGGVRGHKVRGHKNRLQTGK